MDKLLALVKMKPSSVLITWNYRPEKTVSCAVLNQEYTIHYPVITVLRSPQ